MMEPNADTGNAQATNLLADLTKRQQLFVLAYCQYRNGTRAARAAGYAEKGCRTQAYRLLTNADILSAISALMEQYGMSTGECIGRLTAWARGTMEPFLTKSGELTLTSDDAVENWHLLKKVRQKKTTRTTLMGERIEEVQTEIELHDAKDAVDKMLQVHGRYKQLPGDANQPKVLQSYTLPDGTAIVF